MKNKSSENNKKSSRKSQNCTVFLLIVAILIILMKILSAVFSTEDKLGFLSFMLFFSVSLIVSIFAQIIIHEAGHLVFGLASGYKFSSFRIFSLMLVRINGKIKLKRLSLAGTAGQCLMTPPEMTDGKFPVILYNLGGSLMNMIVSLVALTASLLIYGASLLSISLMIFSVIGIFSALTNGIPLNRGAVKNDGYNAFALYKNKDAMRSFWIQMQVNNLLTEGKRLKDMPDEWFVVPSNEDMKNHMVAVLGVFACNRLMDEEKFSKAADLMEHLLEIESGIVGLHKGLMACDMIYCELIGECRAEIIEKYLTQEQKNFMQSMRKFISVIRTEYVLALLLDNDKDEAEEMKKSFEKQAVKHPYTQDVESEKRLLEIADVKARNRVNAE